MLQYQGARIPTRKALPVVIAVVKLRDASPLLNPRMTSLSSIWLQKFEPLHVPSAEK